MVMFYLLLKACEVIPKVVRNPLLFGRVTTYVFMILVVGLSFFLLERVVLRRNSNFYMNDFWSTLAMLLWQKVLTTFIYDFKIRGAFYVLIYTYYSFRISVNWGDSFYNLYKCSIYVAAEMILVVDNELKNYASF